MNRREEEANALAEVSAEIDDLAARHELLRQQILLWRTQLNIIGRDIARDRKETA
jgi:hypothetical protein